MDAHYSIYRGLFNTLCVGIIIGASYQACAPHRPAQATPPAIHPEYATHAQQSAPQSKTKSAPETAVQTQQDAQPQQSEPKTEPVSTKQYKLTPISPEGGDLPDYVMVVKQCYRAEQLIKCWGTITNTTDARASINAYDSRAFDDEGNSFGIGFSFSGGVLNLPPSLPLKFSLTIDDPHLNVKTVALELNVAWEGRHNNRVFKNIPVQ